MIQYQQWSKGQRILITDEQHHGSVMVSIPRKDAKFNSVNDKADACISALWVDEPYRKQGVARLLLETAEREAKKAGCRKLCLSWDKQEGPQWLVDWVKRLGYK